MEADYFNSETGKCEYILSNMPYYGKSEVVITWFSKRLIALYQKEESVGKQSRTC